MTSIKIITNSDSNDAFDTRFSSVSLLYNIPIGTTIKRSVVYTTTETTTTTINIMLYERTTNTHVLKRKERISVLTTRKRINGMRMLY